jgi:hypothetical protein
MGISNSKYQPSGSSPQTKAIEATPIFIQKIEEFAPVNISVSHLWHIRPILFI